jgi:hypothetical protein
VGLQLDRGIGLLLPAALFSQPAYAATRPRFVSCLLDTVAGREPLVLFYASQLFRDLTGAEFAQRLERADEVENAKTHVRHLAQTPRPENEWYAQMRLRHCSEMQLFMRRNFGNLSDADRSLLNTLAGVVR